MRNKEGDIKNNLSFIFVLVIKKKKCSNMFIKGGILFEKIKIYI
jgi:hypothetical protein